MVVRTKDARSANVLEAVKQLADQKGVTISEMAIKLFEMGLVMRAQRFPR